jgi:predicted nucleic-acid-binding Zn-ribbon protein
MKCPKCESENTQRLEVAFHSGTQNISTNSSSTGFGIGSSGNIGLGVGRTQTSGQSQSILAQQISPPAKQPLKYPIIGIALGGFVTYTTLTTTLDVSTIVVGLLIAGISGYLFYSRFQFNAEKWPSLYQRWSESWICHKCGCTYHNSTEA